MSIELKPSRNWPGRTDLIHRTHPGSSLTSSSPLTPEDIEELVQALTAAGHINTEPKVKKSEMLAEATAAIESLPANAVEAHHKQVIAGLLALINKPEVKVEEDEELTIYGYMVVGRDGKATHGGDDLLTQQEAIDNAAEWTKDAKDAGIDWDYRVAAIVDQGGL